MLDEFKRDLLDLDDGRILDRYYYSGPSAILANEQVAELRRRIATEFKIPMRDVVIVGSCKLGFTLTQKDDRPPFSPFSDQSDIDVAIISNQTYLKYWRIAYKYWDDYGDWQKIEKFKKYMFRGWLRPDMLPKGEDFPEQKEWWDFLISLQQSGDFGSYPVRTGVYYDELFWENYASSTFNGCRKILEQPL